jgi:hypothetical protein
MTFLVRGRYLGNDRAVERRVVAGSAAEARRIVESQGIVVENVSRSG